MYKSPSSSPILNFFQIRKSYLDKYFNVVAMIPSYPRLVERGLGKEGGGEARDLFVARTRNVANVYVRHMDVRVSTKSEEIPVSFFPFAGEEGRKEGKERNR